MLHPGQSNDSTLNLDVITPFIRHTSQQKGIVTSTPADGLVSVEPPPHMAAPTPILPQGIATSTRVQGAVGGAGAVKKTPRDKIKTQALVSKKQVIRTTGKSFNNKFVNFPLDGMVVHHTDSHQHLDVKTSLPTQRIKGGQPYSTSAF